jgi:hypothetical protein
MSKYECPNIKATSCHKFQGYCHLESIIPLTTLLDDNGKKRGFYLFKPKYIKTVFEKQDFGSGIDIPAQNYHYFEITDPASGTFKEISVPYPAYPDPRSKNEGFEVKCRKIQKKVYDAKFYSLIKDEDLIKPAAASAAAVLSEVVVPSPEKLVVSDLPKSNSGVAKTEQVMEQVMAANVSKGILSRKKSLEVLASPATQAYTDLRKHLTQGEVIQLDADMEAVHSRVDTILKQKLAIVEEKKALQKLFDDYDLCQYVRTEDKLKLTIPELTAILTSFGEVDKRVRQATTRSSICYIILSVVLMDPKTFIENLAGINKGSYSKK